MEHPAIEDGSIVERYVTGALPDEERLAFEEHLVECARCQEQVEWTEDFRGALRHVAAETAARPERPRPARLLPRLGLPLAAGLAVAALGLYAWALRKDAGRSEAAAREWQDRYESERTALDRARSELASALEKARTSAAGGVVAFLLGVVRDGQSSSTEAARLSVPADTAWIVLSLELEPDPAMVRYRAQVRAANGAKVHEVENVVISRSSTASLLLPSTALPDGTYAAALSGELADGRVVPIGSYRFRIERRPHP